jgi:hypothetical protein
MKKSLTLDHSTTTIRNPVNFLTSYFNQLAYEDYPVVEKDDCIYIGNVKLKKPFV